MTAFASETLLEQASEATGLTDFGAPEFRDGLDVYLDSAVNDAQLNEIGTAALPATVVSALANRLAVVDWHKSHPEVGAAPIVSPIVVIGMFRAGTTLLSNLFAQDAGSRALLRWESGDSVPPPTPADLHAGPRVEAARAGAEMLDQLNPAVRAIHHEEADGPTECIAVMSQDFKSVSWEAITNVPTYSEWLWSVDQHSAYEYHRGVLQVLQSGGAGGRWTLKSPHHAMALDPLTDVFPDARLVLLHRDPAVLTASVCSLISTLSRTFSDGDHTAYIARHWTWMLEESIRRVDEFRAAHPGHRIIDVHYADLVGAPVDTMRRLYADLDQEFDPATEDAVRRYVAANPKGSKGRHGYDLATFGLRGDELTERFAGYIADHDIPLEPRPR